MCGIVGYIGKYDTTKILLDGLKELELAQKLLEEAKLVFVTQSNNS